MGQINTKIFYIYANNHENYKIIKNEITVEHSKTNQEITTGLMHRKNKLLPNHGMLFHMPTHKIHKFWMKNTHIPLDIIFLNKKHHYSNNHFTIIGFSKNTTPLSEKLLHINKPSSYILEINSGWIDKNNVSINDTIVISNLN